MSKWTPGPWYHLAGLHVSTTVGPDWSAADKYIAQVERPYDARLIAAAPEMIEALKEARTALQLLGQKQLLPTFAVTAQVMALAAIEKAEGKS